MENQEMDIIQKNFDLGTILSLTSHRMLCEMNEIQGALNYLTGDKIMIHQIPRVLEQVNPYVLSLYPQLEGVGLNVPISSKEEAMAFVNSQKEVFGESLPLLPMSKTDGYSYVDPREELANMVSERSR